MSFISNSTCPKSIQNKRSYYYSRVLVAQLWAGLEHFSKLPEYQVDDSIH